MDLKEIERALSELYATSDHFGKTVINPSLFLDGDGTVFFFTLEENKYMRIETDDNFEAFFEQISEIERDDYWKYVERINKRYGTEWDQEKRRIFIRFRRNDMSIGEAVTRLHQAVMLLSGLSWYTFI